jgi:hypothetical protein
MMRRPAGALLVLLSSVCAPHTAMAQRVMTVTIPAGVSFSVGDVSRSVSGTPGPFRVTFNTVLGLSKSEKIAIAVKADAANFAGPGSTMIPASKVSWTAAAVGGGSASAGTLSSAAYGQVFQSNANVKSGEVDLTWSLASIAAAGLRSGTHTLTVRWRLEVL